MAIFDRQTNGLFSDFAMQAASAIVNPRRNATYAAKLATAYNGPRVLVHGDSWCCYPNPDEMTLPLVNAAPLDIVRLLNGEFAVFTQSVPGITAWGMSQTTTADSGILAVIAYRKPDVFLFSAGGNDLLGNAGLATTLLKGPKKNVNSYFGAAFTNNLAAIMEDYAFILKSALASRPEMNAVLHSYAYALDKGPGRGPWLHSPMNTLLIPKAQRNAVIRGILDRFHEAQKQLAKRINMQSTIGNRVFVADTRAAVPDTEWFDEIHPSSAGFRRVAKVIRSKILAAHPLVA